MYDMPTLGLTELLIILGIAVLLFGAGKIPQIGKAIGKGIKEFKDAQKDSSKED